MTRGFPRIRLIAFLIIVAMPFAAFADPVGRQSGGGSTMDWQLNATGHEKATLRWVGPDGEVGSLDFPNGKNITLRLQDLGTELQNGQYSWELRLSPKVSKDVAKKLEAARAANDDKAAKKIMKDAGFNPDAMVMSGAFRVENGMFVSTDGSEGGNAARPGNVSTNALSGRPNGPIAANDQVIPDDLIVQGSACVGFDCVNNESFGFDTIRLKENSTRIKFEDTSVGSFPSNDWQLTANDSASGGANKFSIEDITGSKVPVTVTAGASTNSIFVDSTGRVGFRTSTPVLDLHVATSNTPAIRLEQNSSGGFTAQTWDVAGNEANFFVRDVTGGSRLPFRIRPGAPTSSIDISADGDVGIGTASPNANANVDVSSGDQLKARIALTGQEYLQAANTSTDGVAVLLGVNRTNNRQLWIGDTAALTQNSTNRVIRVFPFTGDISAVGTDGTTTKTLTLNSTGGFVGIATPGPSFPLQVGDAGSSDGNGAHVTTGGVWTDGSSREFKQDIMELRAEDAKAAVAALRPVTYRYKRELDEQYVGFIAEDVPDLVAVNNRHYLAPMDIVATLTKVVQEQQKTIDDLSKKVEALQQKQQ